MKLTRGVLAAGTFWAALALGAMVLPAAAARAQDGGAAAAETAVPIDIPAQPLGDALRRLAEQARIQLGYSTDLVAGKQSSPVSGTLTPRDALNHLLAGTGLAASISGNTATIRDTGAADGERVTGAVRVQGMQGSPYFGGAGQMAGVNGVNGSRDITATEGTKSFTSGALTVGSKVEQAIKDVPQSISVLTSEQLKQQNITDFTSAMQQLPGISLAQGTTSLESTFYSRGFQVDSIQVDGGAPLTTNFAFYPQIDMSVYDHVELVRGANGVFNGYDNPSGTVNLVRKKPLDHQQFSLEAQAGSWSNYRVVADATAPLAFDGRLRGRLVMTYQNNHHFYDIANDNKELIYGIAELDATPTTLVTAGISYTRQDSVPWQGGLPRFLNGGDLKLPRSTCLCFSWNRWKFDTTEIFGSVEQKIADDWKLKVNLTQNRQSSTQKLGYSFGAVNPVTDTGPYLQGTYSDTASNQFSAEAVLNGAITILGQRQEITIGANRVSSSAGGGTSYANLISSSASAPYQPYPGGPSFCYVTYGPSCPAGTIAAASPPINVFNFNPNDPLYTEPANPLPSFRLTDYGAVQTGAFVSLRLTAFDRLHLTTALRWTKYVSKVDFVYLCADPNPSNCNGSSIGQPYSPYSSTLRQSHVDWPPSVSISYDLTKQLTAYVGSTNIYQSQSSEVTSAFKPLPPVRGSNLEGGLKWAARGGKLNLSLSAYRIKQKGFGMGDPNLPFSQPAPGEYCCYLYDPNQIYESEGLDFEAAGEIRPGWQIAASYSHSTNKYEGSTFGSYVGQPFTSIQPKNLYKLWTSYDFGAGGRHGLLSGLTLSGGINGQSSAFYAGSICVNPISPPPPPGEYSTCVSFGPPDMVSYSFTVPGYLVASARIDYRLSPKWSLALNVENLFDRTYYQTVGGGPSGGNWYGPPRSFMATLRAKW